MRKLLWVMAVLVLFLPAAAYADEVDTLFKQANTKAEAHQYDEALVLYRKALAISPDEPNIVYNAALTAYLGGKYDEAIDLWRRYRKLAPDDWRGLAKLVQAQEAAGKHADAEASINELLALRKKGLPDLVKQKSFVRDQITIGPRRFLVYQFFELKPETRGHLYDFVEVGADGKAVRVYYVQYDEMTSKMVREQGDKNAELYFFDVIEANGAHASFTRIAHRPDYREARATMLPILQGKTPPASSTRPK